MASVDRCPSRKGPAQVVGKFSSSVLPMSYVCARVCLLSWRHEEVVCVFEFPFLPIQSMNEEADADFDWRAMKKGTHLIGKEQGAHPPQRNLSLHF